VPDLSDDQLARRLRTGDPAVLGRLHQGQLLLDPRTVFADQETALVEAVAWAVRST
jgi:L-seryl-tRNA(Ser) seleniumtransferase